MDKKKVKELIEQAIGVNLNNLVVGDNKHNAPINQANALLNEALKELSKSDWISVEEGLPPFDKDVLTKTNDILNACYFVSARDSEFDKHYMITYDENDFQVADKRLYVTHWKPIEKLEE